MSHSDPGGRCASNHSRLVNARVPIRGAAVGPRPAARPVSKPRPGGGGTTAPRRLTGRGGAKNVGGEGLGIRGSGDSHEADRGLVDVAVDDTGGLVAGVDHLAVARVDAHVTAEVDDVAGLGLSSGDEGAR